MAYMIYGVKVYEYH